MSLYSGDIFHRPL